MSIPSVISLNQFVIVFVSSSSSCRSGAAVHIPYLLFGAGALSFAAFRAIKARDPKGKVNQISFF